MNKLFLVCIALFVLCAAFHADAKPVKGSKYVQELTATELFIDVPQDPEDPESETRKMLDVEGLMFLGTLFYDEHEDVCSNCKEAQANYDQAVTTFMDSLPPNFHSSLKFVQVDCTATEENKEMCAEFSKTLEGHEHAESNLPRIMFSLNQGTMHADYQGDFSFEDISVKMEYIAQDALIAVTDLDVLDTFLAPNPSRETPEGRSVRFLATLQDPESGQIFHKVASFFKTLMFTHVEFGMCPPSPDGEAELDAYVACGLDENGIKMELTDKQADGSYTTKTVFYEGDYLDIAAIDRFVTKFAMPSVSVITPDNFNIAFHNRFPVFTVIVDCDDDAGLKQVTELAESFEEEFWPDLHFFIMKEEVLEVFNTDVKKKFGEDFSTPFAVIMDQFRSHVYYDAPFASGDLSLHTEANYRTFIESYLAGDLVWEAKSEAPPAQPFDKRTGITTLVGSTVADSIADDSQFVLIYMYKTKDCPSCAEALPLVEQLALDFLDYDEIVIATINCDTNDAPAFLEVGFLPAITFFPSESPRDGKFAGIPVASEQDFKFLGKVLQQAMDQLHGHDEL